MGLQSQGQVDGLWSHFLDYTNAYGGNDGDDYYFIVAGADLGIPEHGLATVTRRNALVDDGHSTGFTSPNRGTDRSPSSRRHCR